MTVNRRPEDVVGTAVIVRAVPTIVRMVAVKFYVSAVIMGIVARVAVGTGLRSRVGGSGSFSAGVMRTWPAPSMRWPARYGSWSQLNVEVREEGGRSVRTATVFGDGAAGMVGDEVEQVAFCAAGCVARAFGVHGFGGGIVRSGGSR